MFVYIAWVARHPIASADYLSPYECMHVGRGEREKGMHTQTHTATMHLRLSKNLALTTVAITLSGFMYNIACVLTAHSVHLHVCVCVCVRTCACVCVCVCVCVETTVLSVVEAGYTYQACTVLV